MNQMFHVVWHGEDKVVRLPLLLGEKYYSKESIHPVHELKQFLEALGLYAIATVNDNLAMTQNIINDGYRHDDGQKWYVAGGYVRDEGTVLVLTPKRMSAKEFFHLLFLHVHLEVWQDTFKCGKYLKRLFSHHRRYLQIDNVKMMGDVAYAAFPNGEVITIKYYPAMGKCEGMGIVHSRLIRLLNRGQARKYRLPDKVGSGVRVTLLGPKEFNKNQSIVLDHVNYDMIVFGGKPLLTGDKLTIGMDELHAGPLFTDVQSMISFQMYRTPFPKEWALRFMNEVIVDVQDEESLRRKLRFYHVNFHLDEEGEWIWKDKDWALLRAQRAGIPINQEPSLLLKVWRLMSQTVMNCDTKVRIPVPGDQGLARYAMVDPTIFDAEGLPNLPGQLWGSTIYVPGAKDGGEAVIHRQPNAHRGEHYILKTVRNNILEAMDTGVFVFISQDIVEKSLLTLGGGDQDDRLVIYIDPRVVAWFKSLSLYPVVPKEKAKPMGRMNRFRGSLVHPYPVYDNDMLLMIVGQVAQQHINIGMAVNPLMLAHIITDQLDVIIEYLEHVLSLDEGNPKIKNALDLCVKYQEELPIKGPKLIEVASRLEAIIDAVKKEGADVSIVREAIKEFWTWLPIVPDFCRRGGFNDMGRIPPSRQGDSYPVVVFTEMDKMLDEIKQARIELEDYFIMQSWQLLKPTPEEILTYPAKPEATQMARAIRTYWNQERVRLTKGVQPNVDLDAFIKAILKTDQLTYEKFKGHALTIDAMIDLYGLIHERRLPDAPIGDDGRPTKFPDSILWGPYMSGLTMRALEKAGLTAKTGFTGRYVQAKLEHKIYAREVMNVRIDNGVITKEGTDIIVGTIDPMADGQTLLEYGFVRVDAMDALPYSPQPKISVYTVVAGLAENQATPQEIAIWQSHVFERVNLIPYVYVDKDGEEEHAVHVTLMDGTILGNLTRRDAPNVYERCQGDLCPGNSPRTLCVTVVKE